MGARCASLIGVYLCVVVPGDGLTKEGQRERGRECARARASVRPRSTNLRKEPTGFRVALPLPWQRDCSGVGNGRAGVNGMLPV